ncbi:TBC1 domain family member 2B [Nymphon striatum]|nr:TBC1 domain family member 2B [Nymphon striatum]
MLEILAGSSEKSSASEENAASLDGNLREKSVYSGYLNKLSHKSLIKTWKKRWFTHSDASWNFQYFTSHQDSTLLGVIDISNARFSIDPIDEHPYTFKIRTPDREYVLEASSKEVCFKWLSRFQNSRRNFSLKRTENLEKGVIYRDMSLPESGLLRPNHQDDSMTNEIMDEPSILNTGDDEIFLSKEQSPYAHFKRQFKSALRPKSSTSNTDMKLFSKLRPSSSISSENCSETTFERSSFNKIHSEDSASDSNIQTTPESSRIKRLPRMQSFRLKFRSSKDEDGNSPTRSNSCSNCMILEDEVSQLKSEKLNMEEELEACQEVIKVLQKHLSTIAEGEDTINQLLTVRCGKETKDLLQTKDEKNVNLEYKIRNQETEIQNLQSQKNECDIRLHNFEEQCDMLKGLLEIKDKDVMSLTNKVFELESKLDCESNNEPQKKIVDQNCNEQSCSKCQTSEDAMEAYQLQNQFLNSEIIELNKLIEDANTREEKILTISSNMEAKLCQVQSKYLLLLKELHSPRIDSDQSVSLVSELVQDALEQEAKQQDRKTYSSTMPKSSRYDEFGFNNTWGIEDDDALVLKVENLKQRSNVINESLQNTDYEQWLTKWDNFMRYNENKEIQNSPELKLLVRSGIPHKYRGNLWKRFVDLKVKNIRGRMKSNYYHTLLASHTNVNHLDPFVKQIELDLLRTLPNNKHYETLHSDGIPRLRRVLLAYSWRNPTVGYCQGINRLAAVALLFLDEEDTFWCLVAIIEKIMPVDYYSKTLITSQVDQRVLKDLMQEKLPRLYAHLEAHNVDLSLVTFTWLLTVFVDNIPVKTYLNIWDSFLYEGSKILFRYALAIFKYTEENLLKLTDYMSINTYLRGFSQTLNNIKALNQLYLGEVLKLVWEGKFLVLYAVFSDDKDLEGDNSCHGYDVSFYEDSHVLEIAFHGLSSFSMRSIASKRIHHTQIVRRELDKLEAFRSSEFLNEKQDSASDDD